MKINFNPRVAGITGHTYPIGYLLTDLRRLPDGERNLLEHRRNKLRTVMVLKIQY